LGSESIKVLVRINEGKLTETMWSPSTKGTAAFAPNAIQFIRALPNEGKIFIRAFGYRGETLDGEFHLGNPAELREKIAQACNWPAERPRVQALPSEPKTQPTPSQQPAATPPRRAVAP
jgi:hypothetical protein